MSEEKPLNQVEKMLASLMPATAALDRDRLMYEAGRASAAKGGWTWPLLTAASLLVACSLAVGLSVRPATERVVYVPIREPAVDRNGQAAASPVPAAVLAGTYLQLRRQVEERGIESLPPPSLIPPLPGTKLENLLES